jgi:hypothetical protein
MFWVQEAFRCYFYIHAGFFIGAMSPHLFGFLYQPRLRFAHYILSAVIRLSVRFFLLGGGCYAMYVNRIGGSKISL